MLDSVLPYLTEEEKAKNPHTLAFLETLTDSQLSLIDELCRCLRLDTAMLKRRKKPVKFENTAESYAKNCPHTFAFLQDSPRAEAMLMAKYLNCVKRDRNL